MTQQAKTNRQLLALEASGMAEIKAIHKAMGEDRSNSLYFIDIVGNNRAAA